jgi:sterol 24-C-methyltransferase
MTEYLLLDNFNRNNKFHLKLFKESREILGGGGSWHYKYWEKALTNTGFKIVKSSGGTDEYLIKKEKQLYAKIIFLIDILVKCKIINPNLVILLERLNRGVNGLILANEMKLLTTTWHFIAIKPKN